MMSSTMRGRSAVTPPPQPISRSPVRHLSFLVGIGVAMSGLSAARLNLGGLSGHPHFLLLPVVALMGQYTIARTPQWVRYFAILASAAAALAFVNEGSTSFGAKAVLTAVSAIVWAGFYRNSDQVVPGAAGYLFGIAAIVFYALLRNERGSFYGELIVFDVGNKNSTALYVLPAFILCVVLFRQPTLLWVHKLAVGSAGVVVLAGTLQSENRAALGGLAIILFATVFLASSDRLVGRRATPAKRAGAVLLLAVSVIGLLTFGPTNFIQAATGSGRRSSAGTRTDIIQVSWEAFISHPMAGVGPATLERSIAESSALAARDAGALATHNLYATILGGFGVVGGVIALLLFRSYWRCAVAAFDPPVAKLALALFLYEGLFSDEVLFAPPFIFVLILSSIVVSSSRNPMATQTDRQVRQKSSVPRSSRPSLLAGTNGR